MYYWESPKKSGRQQFSLVIEEASKLEGEETLPQAFLFAEAEDEQSDGLPAGMIHLWKIPFVGNIHCKLQKPEMASLKVLLSGKILLSNI